MTQRTKMNFRISFSATTSILEHVHYSTSHAHCKQARSDPALSMLARRHDQVATDAFRAANILRSSDLMRKASQLYLQTADALPEDDETRTGIVLPPSTLTL